MVALKQILSTYQKGGYKVVDILADNQFECVRGELSELGASLNIASADEHVPEIERCIRTIKERVRSIYISLSFKKMPNRLVAKMIYTSVYWLNSFPSRDGVSNTSVLRPWSLAIHQIITITASLSLAHMCKHMRHTTTPWHPKQSAN